MTGGKCIVCKIAMLVVIIGALNWGAIAFFQTDLVLRLLGPGQAARIVYGVVGVAGLMALVNLLGFRCPCCKKDGNCAK
jgi:uncharacterized membrane protein YuzA (DUF378 family)